MLSICGAECCDGCNRRDDCGGCVKSDGHPLEERALRESASNGVVLRCSKR